MNDQIYTFDARTTWCWFVDHVFMCVCVCSTWNCFLYIFIKINSKSRMKRTAGSNTKWTKIIHTVERTELRLSFFVCVLEKEEQKLRKAFRAMDWTMVVLWLGRIWWLTQIPFRLNHFGVQEHSIVVLAVECIDAQTNTHSRTVSLCVSLDWGEIMKIYEEFERDCFEHGRLQTI